MVDPRAAGVMFTLNPVDGDPSKVVIEGSWGLGESIVSGLVDPDRFEIDKVSFEIKRHISHKMTECVYDAEKKETVQREIPPERCDIPCLSDEELIELVKIGKRIEKYYMTAQDIEWAIANEPQFPGNIFILQTRPETVWSQRKRGPVAGGKRGFDLIMEKVRGYSA
jgi:pyruvate,water dikinase